jgi:hypothetical protein
VTSVDKYEQLDKDLDLIGKFDRTINKMDVGLGEKIRRYEQDYLPAVERVRNFCDGWTASLGEGAAEAVSVGSDDDVPF